MTGIWGVDRPGRPRIFAQVRPTAWRKAAPAVISASTAAVKSARDRDNPDNPRPISVGAAGIPSRRERPASAPCRPRAAWPWPPQGRPLVGFAWLRWCWVAPPRGAPILGHF